MLPIIVHVEMAETFSSQLRTEQPHLHTWLHSLARASAD